MDGVITNHTCIHVHTFPHCNQFKDANQPKLSKMSLDWGGSRSTQRKPLRYGENSANTAMMLTTKPLFHLLHLPPACNIFQQIKLVRFAKAYTNVNFILSQIVLFHLFFCAWKWSVFVWCTPLAKSYGISVLMHTSSWPSTFTVSEICICLEHIICLFPVEFKTESDLILWQLNAVVALFRIGARSCKSIWSTL